MTRPVLFEERKRQIVEKGKAAFDIDCNRDSLAGAVSQRACVFCGSRVVLYPIADALHLVHGPIGCAVYTWDIRGALSSGPELHRLSFSTDLQEKDVIFGGEKKLEASLLELIDRYQPQAAFVYSTCIVGLIGDDLSAVCNKVAAAKGIPVLPVQSEGFKGNKRAGYEAACRAMFSLVGTGETGGIGPHSINILGDFNLAGETWLIRDYFAKMGVSVVANITGDGRVKDIQRSHGAALNVVQCSGATMDLARMMQEKFGTPVVRVSYFGIEDMAEALYTVARFFKDPAMMTRTRDLVRDELANLVPELEKYRLALTGKKAAIYVGGAFKAFSLVKAFRHLGMRVVLVGSQTGTKEDYAELAAITDPGTIIVDDANPLELSTFLTEKEVDLFVGGVKERPIAYKLGVAFCDHNHERKEILAGFAGMRNFAREVYGSVMSPVWNLVPKAEKGTDLFFSEPDTVLERGDNKKNKSVPFSAAFSAVSTTNACKLCTPMGAAIAFRGIEGAVPFLHGSQGCATYMRRYIISHFNEPIDIASSSLGEKNAVFGGGPNLMQGLANVTQKYRPQLIGIATTCLTETIGDDVPRFLKEYQTEIGGGSEGPLLVHVATPSYSGTHMEGFHAAIRAVVTQLARGGERGEGVNLLPGFVSPADLRHLKEIMNDFGLAATILPDYSDTLDGPALRHYPLVPEGGTKIDAIRVMGRARVTIEFGRTLTKAKTAATTLAETWGVPRTLLGLPMGVRETDRFFATLAHLSGRPVPAHHQAERGRLVDAYVDGHKYLSGKRVVIFGEEDLVAGLAAFATEIGLVPVLCATGGTSGHCREAVLAAVGPAGLPPSMARPARDHPSSALAEACLIHEDVDFHEIEELAASLSPDLLIGHSKGYRLARRLGIPLVRVGFPIHDRLGGQRLLHLGYRGAQWLFDTIVNRLIERKQDTSPVGYSYM